MHKSNDYIAFISYRHCPLDIRVAEELRKTIEHYRVPKDLRKDGKKTLGKAFRDRDELPLSSNLTKDIYDALDEAPFLIVVCTPETPKSLWVRREIEYFIQKHGRERVLSVLAAGTPEESFPDILTNVYDTDGVTVLERVEPLFAFLVDEDEEKVLKNLKAEFLRIAAALLECNYDALKQRHKRYQAQLLARGAAAAVAVALLFAGVLINRNRQITRMNDEIQEKNQEIAQQLLQSQINETSALTLLSRQQLADGQRLEALESALNALPHDGDGRPYYAPAEGALADALNIYNPMEQDYLLTISQDADVYRLILSEDGTRLVTLDVTGILRCYDTGSGALLWESAELSASWGTIEYGFAYNTRYVDDSFVTFFDVIDSRGLVMFSNEDHTYAFSLETGALLHKIPFCTTQLDSGINVCNSVSISEDGNYLVQYSQPNRVDLDLEAEDDDDRIHYLEIFDMETFELLHRLTCGWPEDWAVSTPVFSLDSSRLAIAFSGSFVELLVLDTQTWEVVYQPIIEPAEEKYPHNAYVVWLPDNELLLSYEQQESADDINTYYEKFSSDGTLVSSAHYDPYVYSYSDALTHYLTDTCVFYTLGNDYWCAFDYRTMEETGSRSSTLAGTFLLDDGSLMVITQAGDMGYTTGTSKTNYSYIYQPGQTILLATGAGGGDNLVCMVPESAPYTVIIAAKPRYQTLTPLPPSPLEEEGLWSGNVWNLDLITSPDGKELFVIDSVDYEQNIIAITVYDTQTLQVLDWFTIEGIDYIGLYLEDLSGFSADTTKLHFEGYVYDRTKKTLTLQERGEEIHGEHASLVNYPPFYTQNAGSPLLSAYEVGGTVSLWTDGSLLKTMQIPYEMETYCEKARYATITAIGHSGLFVQPLFEDGQSNRTAAYSIYSIEDDQWRLLENPVDRAGFPAYAIGAAKKQVAFADVDHVLRVYDYEQDALIHQWPLDVDTSAINEMAYIHQDQYLMIVTDTYDTNTMHLIDMATGEKLGSHQLDGVPVPYICGDYLYLLSADQSLRIDLTSGEAVASMYRLQGVATVNGQETAFFEGPGNTLSAMPVYSWEELAEMGRELLDIARSAAG